MAVSKSTLITMITSVLILGALAVKQYNGILDGEKVKVVVETVDAQSPTTWSSFLSNFDFGYLKNTLLGSLDFDVSNISFNPIGLVLLLGSLYVNCALGSLAHNGWAEYLPTLSPHVITTNEVIKPLPGHTLYNITDKIRALDVAGWFSKFLATKNLSYISTTVAIKRHQQNATTKDQKDNKDLLAGLLAFLTFGILSRAAYHSENGFATINVWSILGLVACECIAIEQLRGGFDKMVKDALPKKSEKDSSSGYSMHDVCKVWLTMPNGNAVQIFGARGLVRCLLMTPQPVSPKVYKVTQYLSGVLCGIQVLTLGLTSTMYQVVSLSILALSTILLTNKTTVVPGTTTTTIGNELELTVWDNEDVGTHMSVYANMGLDRDEEESMRLWGLMPHASNQGWWSAYRNAKEKMAGDAVEAMD